jgi:hypothetical protein
VTSRRYKSVSNRQQISLLPPSIEDYVHETNSVRAIDAYVETLDLAKQGFQNTAGGMCAGQPAYPPEALLKLYLYGYINRVRSSRRLATAGVDLKHVIFEKSPLTPFFQRGGTGLTFIIENLCITMSAERGNNIFTLYRLKLAVQSCPYKDGFTYYALSN